MYMSLNMKGPCNFEVASNNLQYGKITECNFMYCKFLATEVLRVYRKFHE